MIFTVIIDLWQDQPKNCISNSEVNIVPPLCVDLEFSLRPCCCLDYTQTTISDSLAFSVIDQAAELGVPSMKFNWRGEPLMHLVLKTS